MSNQELQALVEQVSLKDFHRPFVHQARFNGRLMHKRAVKILQADLFN